MTLPRPLPNDPPRFEDYYPALARATKRHVRKLVPSQHVDDVVQETLIALAKHWRELDLGDGLDPEEGERRLSAWVFAFAHKTASSFRRGAFMRRWAGHAASDDEPDGERSVEERAELDERLEILIALLLKPMDEDRRIVFLLKEIDGFSLREIAEMMGIPENTVASRLRAAREEIDERMKRMRKSKGPEAFLGLVPLATMDDPWLDSVPSKPTSLGAEQVGSAMTAKLAGVALASLVAGAVAGALGSARWRREPSAAHGSSPAPMVMADPRPAADTPPPPSAPPSPSGGASAGEIANLPAKAPPRSTTAPIAPESPAVAQAPSGAPAPTAVASIAAAPNSDPPLEAPSDDRLLIKEAEVALKNGDLPRARRALTDHARRFAGSQWRGKREELWGALRAKESGQTPR